MRDRATAGTAVCNRRAVPLLKICIAILCSLFINGCAHEDGAKQVELPASTGPRSLTNAAPSPQELARRFLRALAAEDVAAIKSLRLTKTEFCDYVFSELPSSKVPNLSCDFAWDQATLRSDGGLYDLLPIYKGKKYEMVSLRFAGGSESYQTYKVIKDTRVVIRDEHRVEKEVKLFGSILEMDGQYKLFSFVVN